MCIVSWLLNIYANLYSTNIGTDMGTDTNLDVGNDKCVKVQYWDMAVYKMTYNPKNVHLMLQF